MTQRKLASIQRIDDISPIEGADKIEKARVMGWDVVVKKGEFSKGELCVFFEIDSVLPDGPSWSEFMRARGFRVKTARLRGTLSQGLALPLDILPSNDYSLVLGTDVSSTLGVVKHEPPLPDSPDIDGPFPEEVPKTDQVRLQSALGVLDEIRGREFVITTKLDGMSVTFYRTQDGELIVCSRNWKQRRSEGNLMWRIASEFDLENALPHGIALQGELCGPGIQKNRLGLSRPTFFAFDAYDVRSGSYFNHGPLCDSLCIPTVPVEQIVVGLPAATFSHTLERYLELASAGHYEGTTNRKEGIVVRPFVQTYSKVLGGRLSFKVISNDFLLKDED